VILLDAYGLVAFLAGGPAASAVRGMLREGQVAIVGPNLTEALDVCARRYGLPVDRAMEILEPLLETEIRWTPVDIAVAHRAASLRAAHYHRERRPISLGDALLLAAAGSDGTVATADPDVLTVGRAEQLTVVELPSPG
jgi:uncharacterized protein with PIN domain